MAKFDLNDLEQFEQFIGETKKKIEIQNSKGDTAMLELEPLASKYFGKIVYLQQHFPQPKVLNPVEVKAGRPPRHESEEAFKARLTESDYDTYGMLIEILSLWIKTSYPDLPDAGVRKFVYGNTFILMDAFMSQHNDVDENGEKKELKDFIKNKREIKDGNETTDAKETEPGKD